MPSRIEPAEPHPKPTSLCLSLYRQMQVIRQTEESFVPRILDGTIGCPVHLYSGEEAVAVGVCGALSSEDYVFGTHRSHGHFLAKGGAIEALIAEVYCREDGCSRGRGGSMHLIDPSVGMLGAAPIVGGTIALALGAALGSWIRSDGRVTVAFFGDGATGEGVLFETLNFASMKKLPLLLVCENNLYSTHMPVSEIRVDVPIAEIAAPFGIPALRVDGNDVLAVLNAAKTYVDRCRSGGGPAFLEVLTYRQRGHVGPNDNIQGTQRDIRPPEEIQHWLSTDPIARLERLLLSEGVTSDELQAIQAEIADRVHEAHVFAMNSPRPATSELNRYVFR